jgi:hypothetical protein
MALSGVSLDAPGGTAYLHVRTSPPSSLAIHSLIVTQVLLSAGAQPDAAAHRHAALLRTTVFAHALGVQTCLSVAVSSGTVSAVCGDYPSNVFLWQGETQREMPRRDGAVVFVLSTMSQTFTMWQFGTSVRGDVP